MSEYLLRKRNKITYEIARFDNSSSPINVYNIVSRKCSCPSRYANCKHVKLLKIWQENLEPFGVVYNDEGKQIGSLFGQNPLI